MANIVEVYAPPKGSTWKVTIDERDHTETITEILEWIRESCVRSVYWTCTRFRDPHQGGQFASFRQRHFTDGYLQYTMWFVSKYDAAKFRLRWQF